MTDTGPSQRTRNLARRRAEDCCERRGLWTVAGQIHHRRPRQMGGSTTPDTNRTSNLVLLCPTCHQHVETKERTSAYRHGWLVRRGDAPARCPLLRRGAWVVLTDSGACTPVPSPEHDDEEELF